MEGAFEQCIVVLPQQDSVIPHRWTTSQIEKIISGKIYKIISPGSDLQSIKISFEKESCILDAKMKTQHLILNFGKGFWAPDGYCFWLDNHTLSIRNMDHEGKGFGKIIFKFDKNELVITGSNFIVNGKMINSL